MLGTKLSQRYELLDELGSGGMGVVYRARDPALERDVAVKLIPPSLLSPQAETRFKTEAQLVAKMDHPGIVPIYDLGTHDGSLFFVMPVVEGTSLRAFIKDRSLTLGQILDATIQIAEALDYSHEMGVIHRDIKPENVMVTLDAGDIRVRVMDFGLARTTADNTGITKTGTLVGTMSYLSPEQVASREVGPASDLYSLGTVLYECLTGAPPFSGEMQSILYRIVHEAPQSLTDRGVGVSEDLDRIVLSCLGKEAADRPQSGSDLARTLRDHRAQMRDSDRNRTIAITSSYQVQRAALSPFVGRKSELESLQQRLNSAVQGECHVVVMGGEQGVGKTRLLDELEELARVRKIPVLHGRFLEQDRSFPYHGFCEAIQEFFRYRDVSGSSFEMPDFSDLASELVSLFPMLGEIEAFRGSSSDAGTSRANPAGGAENRTAIFELLAKAIARLGAGRPLVIFFEDLHAADVSIEALQYVARRLGPTPTLVVGTYRSNEIDRSHPLTGLLRGLQGDRRFLDVHLGPFSRSEHERFVSTLIGGKEMDERLSERLFEATEGNPFFTKELVRSLLDSGGIAQDETGSWSLSEEAALSVEAMPATIQQAVEKRIERLPDAHRDILFVASVIGKTFDFRDLETLLPDREELDDAIDELVQDGLVEEDRKSRGDRLTFTNGVVRDVLYAGISRRKRRALHRKVGHLLEERHAGRLERVYPDLVVHFSEGDVPEKSVEYGLHLARRSLESFSAEEAVRSARTALEFLDDEWEGDPAIEGEARFLLSRAHQMTGDVDAALREIDGATRVYREHHLRDRLPELHLFAGRMAWEARRTDDAMRHLTQGLDAAREGQDTDVLRELLSLAVTIANLRGDYEGATPLLEELERLGDEGGASEEEVVPSGGDLRCAISNDIAVSDPADMQYDEQAEILATVYETLLVMNRRGGLVPVLCESWEAREAGKCFVFRIRSGVRFHDGVELTAGVVKECFEDSAQRLKGRLSAAFTAVEGAADFVDGKEPEISGLRVTDSRTLEIHLSSPLPIYPSFLTAIDASLARLARGAGREDPRTVGTGPFRFESVDPKSIRLRRWDDYWTREPARLETLTFLPGTNRSATLEGLREGAIDVGRNLRPEDLDELARDVRFRGRTVEIPGKNTFMLIFNVLRGPAARDLDVRRALAGVLRVRDLVWQTRGRGSEPAAGLISPGLLGHDPGRRRTTMKAEDARALLETSGIERPIHVRIAVTPANRDRAGELLEAIRAAWSELGIESSIVTNTAEEYTTAVQKNGEIDVLFSGWIPNYDDPDTFTHGLFGSASGTFREYFASEESDALILEARSETRPEAREALYRKFDNLLQEQAAVVPLCHDTSLRVPVPKVRGLRLSTTPPYVNYSEVGVSTEEDALAAAGDAAGTVRVAVGSDVNHDFDPLAISFVNEAEVCSNVFEGLTRMEAGRVVPWLASAVHPEEGARRYRIVLRESVRFHNGRRLTARDVRWTFERMLRSTEHDYHWILSPVKGALDFQKGEADEIEGLRIVSANEFVLELEKPTAFLPATLTHFALSILPEGSDAEGRSWTEGVVGTGPFRVAGCDPRIRVQLERFPGYWRDGFPRVQRLSFEVESSREKTREGFATGRYSIVDLNDVRERDALRRDPKLASGYREVPSLAICYVGFNRNEGPLQDRKLREEVASALNPAVLCRKLGGTDKPAHGVIPPGVLGYEEAPAAPRRPAPGPVPENRDPITLTVGSSPGYWQRRPQMVEFFEEALDPRRIAFEHVTPTVAEYARRIRNDPPDVIVGGWTGDFPDTHAIVQGLLHSTGELGRLMGHPELDRLIEEAQVEIDPGRRHGLYRQVEEFIARETLVVPLYYIQFSRFFRPEVRDHSLSICVPFVNYASLSVDA